MNQKMDSPYLKFFNKYGQYYLTQHLVNTSVRLRGMFFKQERTTPLHSLLIGMCWSYYCLKRNFRRVYRHLRRLLHNAREGIQSGKRSKNGDRDSSPQSATRSKSRSKIDYLMKGAFRIMVDKNPECKTNRVFIPEESRLITRRTKSYDQLRPYANVYDKQ